LSELRSIYPTSDGREKSLTGATWLDWRDPVILEKIVMLGRARPGEKWSIWGVDNNYLETTPQLKRLFD